jgi:predicted DNA-binding WGR domain protein
MKYGIITSKGSYITINEEGDIKTYGTTKMKSIATTFSNQDKAQKELDELVDARKEKSKDLEELKQTLRSAQEEASSITTIYTGCKLIEMKEDEC